MLNINWGFKKLYYIVIYIIYILKWSLGQLLTLTQSDNYSVDVKRWDVRQGKAPLTQPTALFRGCDGASILELMPGRSFHLWLDATCRLLTWPLMKQTAVTEVKPWREAHRCLQEGTWSLHSDGQMLCRQGQRDKKPLMKWSAYSQPANRWGYTLMTGFP